MCAADSDPTLNTFFFPHTLSSQEKSKTLSPPLYPVPVQFKFANLLY
uniref:Uncharacterized protein n=1 Tax=Anguilla anguilla TaxID=7936 RepID=A0A0E9SD89_ANGAN